MVRSGWLGQVSRAALALELRAAALLRPSSPRETHRVIHMSFICVSRHPHACHTHARARPASPEAPLVALELHHHHVREVRVQLRGVGGGGMMLCCTTMKAKAIVLHIHRRGL